MRIPVLQIKKERSNTYIYAYIHKLNPKLFQEKYMLNSALEIMKWWRGWG
jgi:hypothetical protein